jgi:hypothetical protein
MSTTMTYLGKTRHRPLRLPARPLPALARVLAAAGIVLTAASCSQVTPLGPAPAAPPRPHHLRSPFVLHAMRVQLPPPGGSCRAGYVTLPGANPGQCYRQTGTPVTITSAAVAPVSLQKPPPGHQAPDNYGFMISLPAADVTALTALTTTAYHARGALAISAAGKTWALPMVAGPFGGPQLLISMPRRSQAVQLQRALALSG